MGLFYSRSAGPVDGEVVFSRRVSFHGFPTTVTLYNIIWGTGCFVDVDDYALVGVESFDLWSFIRDYLPRARELVIRGSGQDLEGSMLRALGVVAGEYFGRRGVRVLGDEASLWASLLYRGLYNYGVLEALLLIGDDAGLTDIYVAPNARVHVKSSLYGDCLSNVVPTAEEVDLLVSVIGDRTGAHPTYYNPSIETYDRGHKPMLRVSVDSFDVTDRVRVSIRVFPTRPWKLIDMVRLGTVDARLAAYLWLALEVGVPILVIGPVGSGKTSLSAALMSALPPGSVIAKVEDIDEVALPQELVSDFAGGVIPLLSREGRTTSVKPLPLFARLVHALRVGADYVFVNEVRSAEDARTWLHAILTGQVGGATTMHAGGVDEALARLRDYGAPIDLLSMVVVLMGRFPGGGGLVRRVVGVWVVDGGRPMEVWGGSVNEDALIRLLTNRLGDPGSVVREVNDREVFLKHYSGFDIDEREWVRLVSLFHRARGLVMPREAKTEVFFEES
ncbi:MAG: ATPase, T2SS/T4P/T4SS family [Vulcanisaeta sp.]